MLSLVIERVAYRPLRNAPRLAPLITAIGVSIVIQTVAMLVWGRTYMTFPQLIPDHAVTYRRGDDHADQADGDRAVGGR